MRQYNPTRSFGPAVVSALNGNPEWDDHWVFWVAPCFGAAGVAFVNNIFKHHDNMTNPKRGANEV